MIRRRIENTYGPWQRVTGEGGVIAVFINRAIKGEKLVIYGDGEQTRDFLYVEDCADFVVRAGLSRQATGMVLNAGTGTDIRINELAAAVIAVTGSGSQVQYEPHLHPQSEIMKLRCDFSRAERVLAWKPRVGLEEGLDLTANWISAN